MSDPFFLKKLKKKLVGMVADQLIVELSDKMPVVLAPQISKLLGITTDPGSFIDPKDFLAMYQIKPGRPTYSLDLGCGGFSSQPLCSRQVFRR